MSAQLFAIYVVSEKHGDELVRRHTMRFEADITFENESHAARNPGFRVELRTEEWVGDKIVGSSVLRVSGGQGDR